MLLRLFGTRKNRVLASVAVVSALLLLPTGWSAPSQNEKVNLLVNQLKDEHWQVRRDAALALADMPPEGKAVIGALAEALRDQDSRVRRASAEALGKAGPKAKAVVPKLINALNDQDAATRQSAAEALGRIGPKAKVAVSPLAGMLEAQEPWIRGSAALALGHLRGSGKAAAPALRKALRDPDSDVRSAAAEALGEIVVQESVPDLIEKLKDEEPTVRQSAADALGRIGKPAVPGLLSAMRSGNPGFLEGVVDALGKVGQPAAPELIQALNNHDQDSQVRQYAAMALARLGTSSNEVVHALVETLKDSDSGVRRSVVEALGEIGPPAGDAIGSLIKTLKDQSEDSLVRRYAAHALARIGPEHTEVDAALTEALKDNDPKVAEAAVRALAETSLATKQDESAARALGELSAQLRRGDAPTRRSAATALGRMGPAAQAVLSSLIEVVGKKDEDTEVRRLAAAAVGSMGPYAKHAVPKLIEVLKDQKEAADVRASAIVALGQIGPGATEAFPALIETLRQQNQQFRALALVALERIGPQPKSPIPAFREALAGANLETRGSAALSIQDFAKARLQQWQPLLSQAEAPVLRSWAARSGDLYGIDNSEALPHRQAIEGRTPDTFNVLGGRAAVRESLQLQLIGAGDQALEGGRTIPISDIPGVRVRSHPFANMLAGLNEEGGRLPLADLAPPDHFFAYFASIPALNDFLGGGLDFLFRLGTAVSAGSIDYGLRARYLGALGLTERQLTDLDQTHSIKEIAVIAPDLFFTDGTELVMILRVNRGDGQKHVQDLLGFGQSDTRGILTRQLESGRKAYWSAQDDLIFFSTSWPELEKVLTPHRKAGREGLGQSAEFRYMLQQLPTRAETRAYFYFSDPFIRHLVGPATKIGQFRRMQARAELEMLTAGALLYKLDGNTGTPALSKLAELGYVPKTFLRRDYTVHENFVVESKIFGTPAHLKSLNENPVERVTDGEAKAYKEYVDNYSKFWSQFFDPIAMRMDSTDDHNFELTTFILPLLDSELYNQLRTVVVTTRKEGAPLKVPALSPKPVLMLSLDLNDSTRLKLMEGLAGALVRYTSVSPEILDSLGSGVHFAILDSEPIAALGSGDILGALGSEDVMRLNVSGDSLIPFLLSVITRPCKLLVELENPSKVLNFLRQASVHRSVKGGEGELYQVKGKDAWIYKVDIERMIQLHLGLAVENGYLVISNFPWSQPGIVSGNSQGALNGALLELNLAAVRQQLPALHTKTYSDYRRDAIEGMGYLYPLLVSGIASGVPEALEKHFTLFGFKPVHPTGGDWRWEDGEVKSSIFGTAERPVQPEFEEGNRDFGLFQKIDQVSVSMQFEDAGLRTKIRWRLTAGPPPGP